MDCLFCKFSRGELEVEKLYEDDTLFVIKDINPKADTHLLVIPHKHVESLFDVEAEHDGMLGYMMSSLKHFARSQGLEGFRTIINTGPSAGQTIFHLHFHLLGGNLPSFE